MINKTFIAKKDSEGNVVMENGEPVMELVESTEGELGFIAPNWLGLEQDLRYSSVFGRRKEVDPVDFNIFTTTLVNGKLGHATENALVFGFSILGLEWTNEEKDLINSLLEKNNFVFRLT